MERFQQECAFLESIRHPNIVQYLGMTRDPESRLPVLLMEMLDESLTKMLERSQQSLAYCIQVDICHDIALAVAYLHSSDIIHRDLSSNNVLMIAGRRAKVTDFGMSKLAGAAPSMTPLTTCPGTLAYMPPETLREPPRYTKKLDCFSEGVIMIQVCTRLWPEPGPRTKEVEDSRSPMGIMEMPISETERRKDHIDLIDPNHALMHIAKDCLQFQEKNRPSSEELCQRLANLKKSREYGESTHRIQDEVQLNGDQVPLLTQQLQEKDRQINEMEDVFLSKDQQIREIRKVLQQIENERDRLLQQKEIQLQHLGQQLKEQEQVTAETQQTNHSLQRQVEQLQQQLSQQSLKPPPPPKPHIIVRQLPEQKSRKRFPVQPSPHKPHPHGVRKMTLNWKDGGKAPFKMSRGAAVVDGDMAYFMNWSGKVCSYNVSCKKWSQLPDSPYKRSSLAVISHQLTAIGGCEEVDNTDTYTDKLLSLPDYKQVFPAMPTKRRATTAVTSKEHLIVAGGSIGRSDADTVNTVEMMDTKSLVWSTVASLPHPYKRTSATICGDQLYMLGGFDDKYATKSMLTCSLTELLRSSSSSIWNRVADAPAYLSASVAVNGELLVVGGRDRRRNCTSAIHMYNPTTDSWDLISNMPTARWLSLVAVLPNNEMMVVGGIPKLFSDDFDEIEIANFSLS